MSDAAQKAREAGKVQADPALKAIQELGDSVATSFEVLEDEQKKTVETFESQVKTLRSENDRLKTEMLAGFKTHGDRINTLDRRASAIGIGSSRDIAGLCLSALSDEDRKVIPVIGRTITPDMRRREDLPLLSQPESSTMITKWMEASAKLQKRRYSSKQEETALFESLERYEKALAEAFKYDRAANFVTTTTTLGGHWLPDPVAQELYRLVLDNSVIGGLASHVPMTTKTLDLPTEGSSALSVSWGSENTAITDSVPASNATNKVTLTVSRLNGFAGSSLEAIQDSAASILMWVRDKLTELAGREIDRQALEGAGSPFTGVSDASGVNEITSGTNGDALTYQTLADTVFKAGERSSRMGARFFCSPEMAAKLVGMTDTVGQPVIQYGMAQDPFSYRLIGYPLEVHSVISSARTWGTGTSLSHLYFGPPKAVVIGDRTGMSWDVSDVAGAAFANYELHMRLVMRLAIAVAVPSAWTRRLNIDV